MSNGVRGVGGLRADEVMKMRAKGEGLGLGTDWWGKEGRDGTWYSTGR